MKKLAAFLLLLTLSLGLLLWLDRGRPARPIETQSPVPQQAPTPAGPSGPGWANRFADEQPGRSPLEWRLTWRDSASDAANERIVCRDVELTHNDKQGGKQLALLEAARSSFAASSGEGLGSFSLGSEVQLSEVVAKLEVGGPLAPLSLRTPALTADLDRQSFRSGERANVSGTGLEASGRGFALELETGSLRFLSDGHLALARRDGDVDLSSSGPLAIERAAGVDDAPTTISADERAHLKAGGARALELWADRVELLALSLPPDGFALSSAIARGHVVVVANGSRLSGETASFRLGTHGSLEQLVIDGSPRGEFPIELGLEGSQAVLTGAGPLTVALGDPPSFEVSGPARVEAGSSSLAAEGGIRGALASAQGRSATLATWGGSRFESHGLVLRAPALDARGQRRENGTVGLTLNSAANTEIEGVDERGTPLRASASGALSFELDGREWRIPSAQGVVFRVEGEQPFQAIANRVFDLRPGGPSLHADGAVQLDSEEGRATGERLEVLARDRMHLYGGEGTPAALERVGRRIEAGEIELDGAWLRARGAVHGTYAEDGASYDVSSDELALHQVVALEADGTRRSDFTLNSSGEVLASIEQPGASYQVSAAHLTGTRSVESRAGSVVSARSTLEASGVLHGTLAAGEERWEIACQSLRGAGIEPGLDGRAASARLLASGEVVFQRSNDPPLSGRCASLELSGTRSARLMSSADAPVHLEGELTGGRQAFRMDAHEIVIEGESYQASAPHAWIGPRGLVVSADSSGLLELSGDRLSYEAPLFELTGNAQLDGQSADGIPFGLSARDVLFEIDAAAAGSNRVRGMRAEGAFDLTYGEVLNAQGEQLVLARDSALLHMEGTPARIRWKGVEFESPWIEFNLLLRSLRTGAFLSGAAGPAVRR